MLNFHYLPQGQINKKNVIQYLMLIEKKTQQTYYLMLIEKKTQRVNGFEQ